MKQKQISLVLETDENFNELNFIKEIKNFLKKFEIKLVGTHIKILKNPINDILPYPKG